MLSEAGFATFDLPEPSGAVAAAAAELPPDPYTPGGQRFRRFSAFKLTHAVERDAWELELLPHRPFVQSTDYNQLVGGVARNFPPLTIDPSPQIDVGAKAIPLDPGCKWQINVHQCRIVATPEIRGVSVPEGPHHDGHEFVMLAVFARHNISGGESQLIPTGGGDPFYRVTLQANQGIVFDDRRMLHYATNIEPLTAEGGYRDLWIVAFDQWEARKYGSEYEVAAVTPAPTGGSEEAR